MAHPLQCPQQGVIHRLRPSENGTCPSRVGGRPPAVGNCLPGITGDIGSAVNPQASVFLFHFHFLFWFFFRMDSPFSSRE